MAIGTALAGVATLAIGCASVLDGWLGVDSRGRSSPRASGRSACSSLYLIAEGRAFPAWRLKCLSSRRVRTTAVANVT